MIAEPGHHGVSKSGSTLMNRGSWPDPLDSVLPAQGWKLHVSATLSSALDVLTQALPVLVAENVPFKVAKSLETLSNLNYGAAGSSQIGKFITVYPRDDEQAVDIAMKLDQATAGLTGPAVPERPSASARQPGLLPLRWICDPGDRCSSRPELFVPVIRTSDGDLALDWRGDRYQAPPWVTGPLPRSRIHGQYAAAQPAGRRSLSHRRNHLPLSSRTCTFGGGYGRMAESVYSSTQHDMRPKIEMVATRSIAFDTNTTY